MIPSSGASRYRSLRVFATENDFRCPPMPVTLEMTFPTGARWGKRHQLEYARPALRWLEGEQPPEIVAGWGRSLPR
jgi:hypothetical protein